MKLSQELKALQSKWKKSKARSVQEPLPDGKYDVKIIDARLERSKNTDRLQVVHVLQVINGAKKKHKDRIINRYAGIDTESNLGYLKADFKKLEVRVPKNILKLTAVLEETIGLECEITIKTKGEWQNIYFNNLLEEVDEEEDIEDDDDEEEEEDD